MVSHSLATESGKALMSIRGLPPPSSGARSMGHWFVLTVYQLSHLRREEERRWG